VCTRPIIPERYGRSIVRALVVSNMLPDAAHPERGRFVRDQVAALRAIDGVEVELHELAPGPRALAGAPWELRRRFAGALPGTAGGRRAGRPRFDVVHAHFGLTAWPALAIGARVRALTVHGSDVRHPRTRVATAAVLPLIDLLGAASASLVHELPGHRARARAQVLPCGVDLGRFRPLPRPEARAQLGLDPEQPCVLFPADPARPEKRHDLALGLARALDVRLVTLGGVAPEDVPLWVNAANAVLVPSEREGFGLAVLEALACDVPVLATPVGVHRDALDGVDGTLCAPFDPVLWRDALAPHVREADPRIEGRAGVERFSAPAMAERVADAWREALARSGQRSG
jgi:teichuronic acid biosynthesis glycosyltransferase TuaC